MRNAKFFKTMFAFELYTQLSPLWAFGCVHFEGGSNLAQTIYGFEIFDMVFYVVSGIPGLAMNI